MFNLLVSGKGWSDRRDTIALSRIFEYTSAEVAKQFREGPKPKLKDLSSLPSLFLEESFGDHDPVARVGIITRASESGNEVLLEYVYDESAAPLRNSQLRTLAPELGIEDFEFYRTHWAIKDADLFRALARVRVLRRQVPKVFTIPDLEEIEPKLVSAMMPFKPKFDAVHKTLVKAVESVGLRLRRADDFWESPLVIQDVVSLIDRSKIVICDCSGRNPNVLYEAGIAHTLGREVILITQREKDIPFDLRHLRYINYTDSPQGLKRLREQLKKRLTDLIGL